MTGIVDNQGIRCLSITECKFCGGASHVIYANLSDSLFGSPGSWNIRECLTDTCRSIWVDPRPLEEELGKVYESYYTHSVSRPAGKGVLAGRLAFPLLDEIKNSYLAKRYGYELNQGKDRTITNKLMYLRPFRRPEVDASIMYLSARPAGKLLDVGCGNGDFLQTMHGLGWSVHGIDVDESALKIARGTGLEVTEGTLESQHFPSEHFDVITMSHVIEHVHDPELLLRECWRVLREDGLLIILTPNSRSLGRRLYGKHWRGWEPPRHLHLFSVPLIKRLAASAGFVDTAVATTARAAHGIFMASSSLSRVGRYDHVQAESKIRHLWGRCLQLAELILIRARAQVGEEILLQARKRKEPLHDKSDKWESIRQEDVCAVMVTYNPEGDFQHRVSSVLKQVGHVVLVDNGSSDHAAVALRNAADDLGLTVVGNGENRGVGTALNQGVEYARLQGFKWILTLDQDSQLTATAVHDLIAALESCPFRSHVSTIGSTSVEDAEGTPNGIWAETDALITSGSLVSLTAYEKVGPFREDFFIDYVDVEWCLRSRARGLRVIKACKPTMMHRIGKPSRHRFLGRWVVATHHDPKRRYYMARNRTMLWRMFFPTEHSYLLQDAKGSLKVFIKMLLYEDSRLKHIRHIAAGFRDGLLGRMGK